jgi:hypothetical protein
MSRNITFVLMYHRHKPLDLVKISLEFRKEQEVLGRKNRLIIMIRYGPHIKRYNNCSIAACVSLPR